MFGAQLTLIVLTGQRLARIDLAGPRHALRVDRAISGPALASHELAASVAIAYRLGEPTATATKSMWPAGQRCLIVLSDDVWNDSLSLPLDVTVLLSADELQEALKIEAENYSGIGAFHSRIATRKLLDTSTNLLDTSTNFASPNSWWLAQIAQSDLDAMAVGAKACGARFVGATHTQAHHRARLMPTIASAASVIEPANSPLDNLADEAALWEFGREWALALSQEGMDLLVQPVTAESSPQKITWLQTTAALLATLSCWGVYQYRQFQLSEVRSQIKSCEQTLASHQATTAELRQAEAKAQSSPRPLPSTPVTKSVLVTRDTSLANDNQTRWRVLLDRLSRDVPENCWVESWQPRNGQTVLCGRAVTAQVVHEMALQLEQSLEQTGWRVSTPEIQDVGGGLVRFQIPLTGPMHLSVGDRP